MVLPHVLGARQQALADGMMGSRKVTFADIAAGEDFPDDEADFDESPPLPDCSTHEARTITMLSGRRYCANCLRQVRDAA